MTAGSGNGGAGGTGNGADEPQSMWDRLFPFLRMFLIWYAVNSFMGGVNTPSQKAPTPAATGVDAPIPASAPASTASYYRNAFQPNDAMEMRVYVSRSAQFSLSDVDAEQDREQLRWHIPDLTYNMASNPQREDGYWFTQLNVSVDDYLLSNGSLYAHVFVTRNGYSPHEADNAYERSASVHRVMPLTVFRPPPKRTVKRNLLQTTDAEDEEKEPVDPSPQDEDAAYISMWKPQLIVNVVYDESVYSSRMRPPPFLATHLELDDDSSSYSPVVFLNDFWVLEDHLMPINGSLTSLPLDLWFYPLPLYKFAFYQQLEQNFQNQQRMGTSTRKDSDGVKRMFLETNPYLLALTMTVSLLHSLFDFLAFKNDVSFWKKQKSLAGLSLRTVVMNTFFQLVIFLYLLDNDTSWMILISSGVSLVIDVWKIKKAMKITRDENNRLVISGEDNYMQSSTAEHDRVAVAHLSFVLYPLIVGHSVYTLMYGVHKGWYSWVISSLTSFVYMFGFIMMTPQLYINYKLKSVAHLPWRAMVYKSLNTFIDDLFAFVIKMPWMHRLSCFRDDLIFFIYLYQRWIYPVDASRTNEFGQGPIDGDETTKQETNTNELLDAPPASDTTPNDDDVSDDQASPTEYLLRRRVPSSTEKTESPAPIVQE